MEQSQRGSELYGTRNAEATLISQAIEAAIELNLKTVEAGAQGEHKIQRGYMPVTTYSCHYLPDKDFRKAIGEFLVREATQVLLHSSIT